MPLRRRPTEAPHIGGGTWKKLLQGLGTRLPAECMARINRYRGRMLVDWLRFVTPFRINGRGFASYVAQTLDG